MMDNWGWGGPYGGGKGGDSFDGGYGKSGKGAKGGLDDWSWGKGGGGGCGGGDWGASQSWDKGGWGGKGDGGWGGKGDGGWGGDWTGSGKGSDWGKGCKGGMKGPMKKKEEHTGPTGPPPTADSPKVFVGGLPPFVEEATVRGFFSQYGEIQDMKMLYHDNGIFKGFAFVTYADKETAQKVYDNYANNLIDGKWVDCKPAADGGREKGDGKGWKGGKGDWSEGWKGGKGDWSGGCMKGGDWGWSGYGYKGGKGGFKGPKGW